MTLLRPTGSQWRTPEMGKAYIVSSWRGLTRVQAWPRKRGLPTTQAAMTRLTVFKAVQALIKWLTPWETEYVREGIRRHNQTHRGQRGSAAIRLRDWQTQRIMGRGPAFTTDAGIVFYPAAVARDASFILDWVTATPGQLLQRNAQEWGPIPAGTAYQVLTSQGPGNANTWAELP